MSPAMVHGEVALVQVPAVREPTRALAVKLEIFDAQGAGITVVDASTPTMSAGTLKSKSSIVAFAFGKEGLMGGWSAKGTKVTKLKFD